MSNLIEQKIIKKSHKEHRCDYCGLPIVKGSGYVRQFLKDDKDIYSWKSHLLCAELALYMFESYEFSEGDVTTTLFQERLLDYWSSNDLFSQPHLKDAAEKIISVLFPEQYEEVMKIFNED